MKLDALKLAISAGILSAICMFLLPIDAMYMGRGVTAIKTLNPIFQGYNVSWYGAGMGLVYGFVTCFIYFGVLALIYNGLPEMKTKKKAGRKK